MKLGFQSSVRFFVALLMLTAQPARAQSDGDRQQVATALINQAISERVGRKVDLSISSKPVRRGPSRGAVIASVLLGGLSGLALVHALHRPKLKVQDDMIAGPIAHSLDRRFAAISFRSGTVAIWDLEQGRQTLRFSGIPGGGSAIAAANDGSFTIIGEQNGGVRRASTAGTATVRAKGNSAVTAIALDSSNTLAAIAFADGGIEIASIADPARASRFKVGERVVAISFSETKSSELTVLTVTGSVHQLSVGGGQQFTKSSTRLLLVGGDFTPSGSSAFGITRDDRVVHIDTITGRSREVYKAKQLGSALSIGKGGRSALVADPAGGVSLIDLSRGERLARLVSTPRGWAVMDFAGRFDGSEGGLEAIKLVTEEVSLDLPAFSKRYFEPGILGSHLSNSLKPSPRVESIFEKGLKLPPIVDVTFPGPAVRRAGTPVYAVVMAEDKGGGVEEVRLFHNGKVLDPGSLIQSRSYEDNQRRIRVMAFRVTPSSGLNTFRATATSDDGVESASPRRTLAFEGPPELRSLHVVAVGVNDYATLPKLMLATADAEAMAASLSKKTNAFQEIRTTVLVNQQATRAAILRKLVEVGQASRPGDTLVVFLSGHGMATGRDAWVFAPVDVDPSNAASLSRSAISAEELQTILVGANAKRVVLAIDSCQSASAFGAFHNQRSSYLRLLRDVSRTSGLVVYAAAQEGNDAIEVEKLGHGVFTYSLLQALQSKPGSEHPSITAFEIADHVEKTTPALALTYKRFRQNTATFRLGTDFRMR